MSLEAILVESGVGDEADIARALVTGEAITALCGKRWVPSRDPERYPICPTCKEIFAARQNAG